MALSATMSLWGLYRYDPTVLDLFQLPQQLDPDVVKNNLIMETASMEILYSDPDFLRTAIGVWSEKELPVWTELYETTQYEYDPIANYDRKEHVVETNTGTSSGTSSGSSSGSRTESSSGNSSGSRTESSTGSSSGSDTVLNKKAAYNSNTLADATKAETTGQQESESSGSSTDTMESESSGSSTDTTETESETSQTTSDRHEFDSTIKGNIGVTTSQQMIEAQRDVVKFNIIDYIINEFIKRFCLMVY